MLPTEQARFFEIITEALGAYGKFPSKQELNPWWIECRAMSLEGLEVALKAHKEDPDRGERAPRPVDLTRRLKTGNRDGQRCAASSPSGQCQYPGIFSDGTTGEGPWYCPWHRQDRVGPEAFRWIDISHNVPWEEASAKRTERMKAEGQRAAAVVDRSHAIALRHGTRPWQTGLAGLIPDSLRDEEAA